MAGGETVFGAAVVEAGFGPVADDACAPVEAGRWAGERTGAVFETDVVPARCTVAPETPAAVAGERAEIEGVVRGGATGAGRIAGSVRTGGLCLGSGVGSAGRAALSAGRGGASRSNSRAAAGGGVVGFRPDALVLRDRRFIRGFSAAGFSKLNSTGSELDSGFAAGEGLSGITPL